MEKLSILHYMSALPQAQAQVPVPVHQLLLTQIQMEIVHQQLHSGMETNV